MGIHTAGVCLGDREHTVLAVWRFANILGVEYQVGLLASSSSDLKRRLWKAKWLFLGQSFLRIHVFLFHCFNFILTVLEKRRGFRKVSQYFFGRVVSLRLELSKFWTETSVSLIERQLDGPSLTREYSGLRKWLVDLEIKVFKSSRSCVGMVLCLDDCSFSSKVRELVGTRSATLVPSNASVSLERSIELEVWLRRRKRHASGGGCSSWRRNGVVVRRKGGVELKP